MADRDLLIEAIHELRGEAMAMRAAVAAVMLTVSGRMQAEVKRSFDQQTERARVALLNSANADQQIAAFDKAVADFNRGFSAPR